MSEKNLKTADIRIIGPRASGKTTYLATLAYFPQKKRLKVDFPGLKVEAVGSDSQKLALMAKDIIERGANLAPTDILDGNEPFYYFRITVPSIRGLPSVVIELNARDFSGEIFQDLAREYEWDNLELYFDDLFEAQGWLVMLTDWQPGRDSSLYVPAFRKLCEEMSERENINKEIENLRIAVVMTKCERGEIWPGRIDPDEDLFRVRLPETYDLLTENLPPERLKFFACSAFGVLSNRIDDFDPRPNRYITDDGSPSEFSAYLRNATQWQPFGLLAPLYWLSTGRTLHDPSL